MNFKVLIPRDKIEWLIFIFCWVVIPIVLVWSVI